MKQSTSFLTRCLAVVLALVLVLSNANLGFALRVSADEGKVTVTDGELVADSYELTAAEKALLNSGLLAGGSHTYTIPGNDDDLITIDAENKTVTVGTYGEWVPTVVRVIANGETVETVDVVNNKASFTYAGDAYMVEVDFVLAYAIDAAAQARMILTASYLKAGLENLKIAYGCNDSLEMVEDAMEALETVANTTITGVPAASAEFKAAVAAMSAEIETNGVLDLRMLNDVYTDGTAYLFVSAADYKEAINNTYNNLLAIKNEELFSNSLYNTMIVSYLEKQGISPAAWSAFKGILSDLVDTLEPATKGGWEIVDQSLLKTGMTGTDFVVLDALVNAIDETTEIAEYKSELVAAKTTLTKSQSLISVNVSVNLVVLDEGVGVETMNYFGEPVTKTLGLKHGATAAEIQAAIDASGIIAEAKALWGDAYIEGQHVASPDELPAVLTEDIDHSILYLLPAYEVTANYGEDRMLPYGYKMILPLHPDSENYAYDYTVNGEFYAQGDLITITGKTEIKRTQVKAYVNTSLYETLGKFWGDEDALAILTAGAIKGDKAINYHEPVVELTLLDSVLTAQATSNSDYHGLLWVPFTYGAEGTENEFVGNTADWTKRQAKVQYKLNLDVTADEASAIAKLVATLKSEYDGQVAGMGRLVAYQGDLAGLNNTKLTALKGVVREFNFSDDVAKNQELRNYFMGVLNKVQANCVDKELNNGYLTIYNMINNYLDDGMAYYYDNADAIREEVLKISGYLKDLVGDAEKEAALAQLLCDPGVDMPQYVEKIGNLGPAMADIAEQLIPANEAIDLNSTSLNKLLTALANAEAIGALPYAAPFILSEIMSVQDESSVMLVADIVIDGVKTSVNTESYDRFTKLDEAMILELQGKINTVLATLGEKGNYYTIEGGASTLKDKIGVEMDDNLTVTVTANAKEYTVKIDGQADQVITINDLAISLPKHPNHPSIVSIYTIDGVECKTSTYTFTTEQLDRLFTNGTYTISVTVRNEAERMLNAALEALNDNTAGNTYKVENGTLIANVAPTGAGLQAFAMGMLNSGYGYIGMNGEAFMYDAGDGLEISLQTLVNAVLHDNTFSNETLIALGQNNGGKVVTTNLQLGMDPETIYEERMGFVLNLTSVPSQMVTLANGLDAARDNLAFYSQDGVMIVNVNLPEKIYELYLTALLAADEVHTHDMNAIDNKIAFMFLYDYVDLILGNDAITATTFQNTLEILGQGDRADLEARSAYYELVKDIYNSVTVTVADEAPVELRVDATAAGLNEVINTLGVDTSAYDLYLGMIRELNEENEGVVLTATAIASLQNTAEDFEALIIDVDAGIEGAKDAVDSYRNDELMDLGISLVKGQGLANSVDYTDNLPERLSAVTGPAAIYLLDDVDGDLVINNATILDLNGFTVNGDIIANGHLLIVDSNLDTDECGAVNGDVSGHVMIIAGSYTDDVSAYLRDGYKQVESGAVKNALYDIQVNGNKITLELNSDFMYDEATAGIFPSMTTLAADIAIDLAMHFYVPASLTVEGNDIFGIDDYFNDIIGLIKSETTLGDLADAGLKCIDASGITATANMILKDLMDLDAIAYAIDNETELGGYTLNALPYAVEIMHAPDGDYMTFGIVADDTEPASMNVNLKFVGNNIKKLLNLVRELNRIIVWDETFASVDVKQPVRDGHYVNVAGSSDDHLSIDLTVHKDGNYQDILAVILAYGNPDKAEALVAAMGDHEALKAVIDEMTVRDVLNTLKALNRNNSLMDMAASVGANVTAEAAELESLYHFFGRAAGKLIEELERFETVLKIEGYFLDSKFGSLDQDGDGTYILQYSYGRTGTIDYSDLECFEFVQKIEGYIKGADLSRLPIDGKAEDMVESAYDKLMGIDYRSYGVNYDVEEIHAFLKINLFDFCLWGDANHDGEVNAKDATLVLQYSVDALEEGQFFCTKRTDVNGDGEINAKDATLILQYAVGSITKFPAEN